MEDVDVMKTIRSTGSSITSTDFCTSNPSDDTGFDDCLFDDSGLALENSETGQRFTSGGSSEGEKVSVSSIELHSVALPPRSVDAAGFFSSAGSESCQVRDEMFEQVSYGTVLQFVIG
jgi:hypothetical protein